ncbi:hypothetical protein E2C01_072909 [Portunus trituberculatus]|uniref:Uncharacterized protein n=1 Tax=Portunus trituberculatus TaxID=210409 RepID=A0A5B7I7Z2_PORTR|nr:hypothetical protein [Portunus trituberculatus]
MCPSIEEVKSNMCHVFFQSPIVLPLTGLTPSVLGRIFLHELIL